MGVVMKGRERMWKNECVSIDLFIHVSGIYIHIKAHTLPPDMDVQGFTT
jgi:hypothetical protein